jgi:hypothetical protein
MNIQYHLHRQALFATGLFLFIGMSVFTSSCRKNDSFRMIRSSGGTLEILVVTDNKHQWEGSMGDTVRKFFTQQPLAMPQPEALFSMANLDVTGFGKMFQTHHNILILNVDPERTSPLLEAKKDLWAKPQRVFKISAATPEEVIAAFGKYKESFRDLFLETEYERTDRNNMLSPEKDIMDMLRADYSIGLNVPKGFMKAVKTNDFLWLRKETPSESFGILIYWEPYTDTVQFSPENIITRRNGFTSRFIPGERDSSFMATAVDVVEPSFRRITLHDEFAVETRGLWETIGDFMGGPFVSFTTVDQKKNRLVTVEGFVYAPNAEKTHLLLQVEAICRTIRFTD